MEGYCSVSKIFSLSAIDYLRLSIKKSAGQEVFWGCLLDQSKNKIATIENLFFGSTKSVIFSKNLATNYDLVLHNHPDNNLEPSDEDQQIAFRCMNLGIGFAIIDNKLEKCYVIIPPHSVKKKTKIEIDKIDKIFKDSKNDFLNILPNYKIRESQIELSKLILDIINEEKVGFIEAPTGIGKSLGYLIPIILYIKQNKVKIVISTYTKNLQNQLIKKDIPISQKILKTNLKIEIAYGRQNYLCLFAYNNFAQNFTSLFFDIFEPEMLNELDNWVKNTDDGLLLNISSHFDKKIIEEIRCNSSLCLGNKCKFFSECFYYNSKRKLNTADIIVSNHHLFLSYELSDEYTESFPEYNTIVFDEGHNLPDVIESLSTFSFSTFEIQKKLSKLLQVGQKSSGLIPLLEITINRINEFVKEDKNLTEDGNAIESKIFEKIEKSKSNITELLKIISNIQNKEVYDVLNLISLSNNQKIKVSFNISEASLENPDLLNQIYYFFKTPFEMISELNNILIDILKYLEFLISNIPEKKLEETPINFIYASLKSNISFFNKIDYFQEEFVNLLNINHESSNFIKVLWLEISSNIINFYYYDEKIGGNFLNIIENKSKSTLFISATLSSDNSFQFIKNQLALNDKIKNEIVEKVFPSIFPYEKNSSFFVINGLNPLEKNDYKKNMHNIILKVVESTKAKKMILATSYNDINDISDFLKDKTKNLNIFIQNEYLYSSTLIDEFKKNSKSILIANMSFWEGVDLPGKELEILIITKLPFKVPDTPILKAKAKRMEENGQNPFILLSLPYAIIKLKQGFGRLIRSENETGICILLDDRIISKYYGKSILNSLPVKKIEVTDYEDFYEKFLAKCKELKISD